MSSKLSVQGNKLGFFNIEKLKPVSSSLKSASSSLSGFKSSIESAKNIVSPFLSALESDAFSAILKKTTSLVSKTMESFLSTGASFIFISPLNTKTKRFINLNIDMLNPVDQLSQASQHVKYSVSGKYISEMSLKELKSSLNDSKVQSDKNLTEQIQNLISYKESLVYHESYIFKRKYSIPKLSPKEAVDELILSFSNTSDKLRPTWNSKTYTSGVGFILCAESQLDLINNLSLINNLIRFTEISKALEQARGILQDYKKELGKTVSNYTDTVRASSLVTNIQAKRIDHSILLQEIYSLRNSLSAFTTATNDDSAKWSSLNMKMIPFVQETVDFLNYLLDFLNSVTERSEDVLSSLLNSFVAKLDWLTSFVAEAIDLIEKLSKLEGGIASTTFHIPPSSSGLGVSYITDSLNELKSFSGDIFNPKLNKHISEKNIHLLKNSNFTVIVFFGVGYTSLSAVKKEFDIIATIFNTQIKSLMSSSSSEEDSESEKDKTKNNKLDIAITPDYKSVKALVTKDKVQFKVVFSSCIDQYTYVLNSISDNSYSKSALNITGAVGPYLDLVFTNLPDKKSFQLTIKGTSSRLNKSIEKNCYFSTDFSMDGTTFVTSPISSDSGTSVVNSNGLEESSSSDVSGQTDSIVLGTTDITIPNNTNSDLQVSLEGDNQKVLTTLYGGKEITIPLIGDGSFTIKVIKPDQSYIGSYVKMYSSYTSVTNHMLSTKKIFIKTEPYQIFFPADLGNALALFSNNEWNLYLLPNLVSLRSGDYPCQIFKNGEWSNVFTLQIILSTSSKDFCLDIFKPSN